MKYIFKLFILFLLNYSNAQQNYVLVEYTLDNYGFVNNETLLANQQNSKHVNDIFIPKKTEDDDIQKSENDVFLIKTSAKQLKIETFQSIGSAFIYQLQHRDKQQNVFIKDSLPDFNWKIESDEKKAILGFECVKATCRFRGTDIVAYFAEKIPVSFGPWKFGRLPGLILEVYTENTQIYYHWRATKIKYPYESKVEIVVEHSLYNVVTLQNYLQKQDLKNAERNNILNARISKGVTTVSSKTFRGGIEKIYEWEE